MNRFILIMIAASLFGCGKLNETLDRTKSMPDKMDKMYAKTSELPCELKSGVSFVELLKEDYGKYLLPMPYDVIPLAKKFAECSSAQDLTEIMHLWMSKFNDTSLMVDSPTAEQVAAFDNDKLRILSSLQAVAGFMLDKTVKQIVEEQIHGDGPYLAAAKSMLMLRVRFLRDIQLETKIFSKGMKSTGQLKQAVGYAESLEYIARLPFASEIAVEINGFHTPEMNSVETLEADVAHKMWMKIRSKGTAGIQVVPKDLTGITEENERRYRERQLVYEQNMAVVNQRITDWETPRQSRAR